ncbi:MAG: hypothetical protein ABJD24_16920 [Acidimicrobiales bacterium]
MASLTDHDFLGAVAAGEEPEGHLSNLRYAWILTSTHDVEEAERLALASVDRRASRSGGTAQADLTREWVRIVADTVRLSPDAAGFEEFLWSNPQLLDRDLTVSA